MKLSLNWIKKFVELPEMNPRKLGELLTIRTAEVEKVESENDAFDNMYVAKVVEIQSHPNADKLKICKLDIGLENMRTLVCGGQNLKIGMLVTYADKGSKVKWHGEGDLITLEYAKIRGVESEGMICAGEEIGLEPDNFENQSEVKIKDLSYLKCKPGTPLAMALNRDDVILEIDNKSLTHRPDLWGQYGFAREFSAIFKTKLLKYDDEFSFSEAKKKIEIKTINANECPYFGALVIENIKITDSPEWLKEALVKCGVKPINNIVDITNFVMLETGQPLHAYDYSKIEGDFIEVRFAKNKEVLTTLDGRQRDLTANDLVVAGLKAPLSIAGVMGGKESEIKNNTTTITIESASFNPVTVRKSGTYHGLRTDAVQRFEKGLDPLLAKSALKKACKMIMELCPDAKLTHFGENDNYKANETVIDLNPEYVNSVIGAELKVDEMVSHLTHLGFEVKKDKKISVKVPSWRAVKDISIQEDLIEEIARMHGYENIEPKLPALSIMPPVDNTERVKKHLARKILSLSLNCNEVSRYSFYSKADVNKCFLDESAHLRVENFLSEDQTHMRTTLIPNLLKSMHLNLKYQNSVRIFEFGRTYVENGYMPIEEKYLSAVFANANKVTNALDNIFYDAKGVLEKLFKTLGAVQFKLVKSDNPPSFAHPKICLDVVYKGSNIGHIFSVHPMVAKAYQIDEKVSAFEINFSKLIALKLDEIKYSPISKLPSLTFDISVVIDEKTEIETVEKVVKKECGNLLRSIKLFDFYEGKNIGTNKKSLAFKIVLHSEEKTLTDEDMAKCQKAIFEKLINIGGEIRGL